MRNKLNKLLVVLVSMAAIPIAALAQDYFQATGIPVQRSAISSAEFRTEFTSIETDISDKLPAYTGNADEFVVVNAGATALTSKTAVEANLSQTTAAATITGIWTFSTDPVMSGIDTTAAESAMTFAANGSVIGFWDDNQRFSTQIFSLTVDDDLNAGHDGNHTINLTFRQDDDEPIGRLGWNGSSSPFEMVGLSHGANLNLKAQDAAGVLQNLFLGDPDGDINLYANGVEAIRAENTATLAATETSLWLYDNDNAAIQQVTVDAADSCGSGFKCLRIVN